MRLAFLIPLPLLVLPVLAACAAPAYVAPSPSERGSRFTTETLVDADEARTFKLFVPSAYDGARPLPLVVMLHGCTQDADDFARGTRMNDAAEEHGFLVVYPEQVSTLHPQKCWRWYDPEHQVRDRGEPALIAGITRDVMRRYAVDPARVYVAGVSAGGAMAQIAGATYPDLFAAVASHSGVAFGAAREVSGALAAMQGRGAADANASGAAAFGAMGVRSRPLPVIVFHGAADAVVHPANALQTVAQWRRTNELAGVEFGQPEASAERTRHRGQDGRLWIESWLAPEVGHAWSGGSAEGSYTHPSGPDATRAIVRFFLDHPREDR